MIEIIMKNIYIINDVHGCYKTLLALIEQFPNKRKSKIVFVGDMIDRGKNSCEVIELIINNNYDCVRGNHENLFIMNTSGEYYKSVLKGNDNYWFSKCGGKETLDSYSSFEVYKKHWRFLEFLPYYIEYKDYKTIDDRYLVVSHSSVSKMWNLRNERMSNLLNYAEFTNFVSNNRYKQFDNKEIFNVYGHTVRSEVKRTDFDCNIDLGCCYKQINDEVLNPRLCALEFPSMKIFTQKNLENETRYIK
jgi:serine/threonine protein phosphatase 1